MKIPEVAPVRNLDIRRAAYLPSGVGNTERIEYSKLATIKTTEVTIPISLTPPNLLAAHPRIGEKITCPIGLRATTQLYLLKTELSSSSGNSCTNYV